MVATQGGGQHWGLCGGMPTGGSCTAPTCATWQTCGTMTRQRRRRLWHRTGAPAIVVTATSELLQGASTALSLTSWGSKEGKNGPSKSPVASIIGDMLFFEFYEQLSTGAEPQQHDNMDDYTTAFVQSENQLGMFAVRQIIGVLVMPCCWARGEERLYDCCRECLRRRPCRDRRG